MYVQNERGLTMTKNTTLNVRVSEQEYSAIKTFADFHGQTISSLVLNTIRSMIEDWEDVRDAEEIIARNEPMIPWEEVQRQAGLLCIE
jgi:uncharacterized protein (DUF1778 family)